MDCKFITLEDGDVLNEDFDGLEEVVFEADTAYAYQPDPDEDICHKAQLIAPVRAKAVKPLRAASISVGAFVHIEFALYNSAQIEVDANGSAVVYADALASADVDGALVLPRTTKVGELYVREGGILIAPSLTEIEILVGGDVVGAFFAPIYKQEPVSDRFLSAEQVAQRNFAHELNFNSWEDLIKSAAGRWAAAHHGFGVEAPEPVKEYGGGAVLKFPDGSVFVAEPRKVYLNWQVFLLKHGMPAS